MHEAKRGIIRALFQLFQHTSSVKSQTFLEFLVLSMCQQDELQAVVARLRSAKIYPPYERFIETYRYVESLCKIKRRCRKALSKQTKTAQLLQEKFLNNLPNTTQLETLRAELTVQPGLNLEDKIVQYWHQGSTFAKAQQNHGPWGIMQCLSNVSIERFYADSRLILDADSIVDYIAFPKDVKDKLTRLKKLPLLSDLIRTAFLFCYGGTWLDFTILLLNKIPSYCLDKEVFYFIRDGELEINSLHYKDIKQRFIAHSPYYFGWDDSFKVNMFSCLIHAKVGNILLGTLLSVLFKFVREEDPREYEYFVYMILFDLLLDTSQFNHLKSEFTQGIPSDACCHILQVFDYKRFNEKLYDEICAKYPVQKLNGGCRLIKGALLYETLRRQQLL